MTIVQPQKNDPRSTIMVATDLSEASRAALRLGGRFAGESDLRVEVLHVVNIRASGNALHVLFDSPESLEALKKAASAQADAFVEETLGLQDWVDVRVVLGHPVEMVVDASSRDDVALLILGATGASGLKKFFFGTTASQVIRGATTPVLVVPQGAGDLHVSRILCPHDFSPESDTALGLALELTQALDAQILLYHCILEAPVTPFYPGLPSVGPQAMEPFIQKASKKLEDVAESFGERAHPLGVEMVTSIHSGILEAAEANGTDIIVMASHGRKGMEHVLGSTAEWVLRESDKPVLLYKRT